MAEALGKHLAGDEFESYSAGTETKSWINQLWPFPWAVMWDAPTLAEPLMTTGAYRTLRARATRNLWQ